MDRAQSMGSCVPDGGSMEVANENGLIATPVSECESGQGLPYAPEDWPNPGDIWSWRAGTREVNGFFKDRYLYPPSHLGKKRFASKVKIKDYIEEHFPNADVDAFFSSFIWRMPYKGLFAAKGESMNIQKVVPKDCNAQNEKCSLRLQSNGSSLQAMECDICCSEPGFCRDCCCILCCKIVDWAYEGFSFIRCEATWDGSYICGHVAHLDCALRSYMAGTVGGSIGLNVEYYCRRCDKRTDLISHVKKLIQISESLDSRDDIERILNLGLCILRGSQKESAKWLLYRIEFILAKLKKEICLEELWNVEVNLTDFSGELSHPGNNGTLSGKLETATAQDPMDVTEPCQLNDTQQTPDQLVYNSADWIELSKLSEEIDRVLQGLSDAQDLEYRIAEERLFTQKSFLFDLHQQLEVERSGLAKQTSSSSNQTDTHLTNILNKVSQIKQENLKFMEMKEVAKGFGRVSKAILKEHFGLQAQD